MKKTEIFIPFTKSLREAVGFDKEVDAKEKYFRCLRKSGYFAPGKNMDLYTETMCKMLLDQHDDALLYTEKGLWQNLKEAPYAKEIYEKMLEACEDEAPEMYLLQSRNDDEYVVVIGYEDRIDAIIEKKGKITRYSEEIEMER